MFAGLDGYDGALRRTVQNLRSILDVAGWRLHPWESDVPAGSQSLDLEQPVSVDVPLAEETERYELDILDSGDVVRTLSSTTPSLTYTAAEQTADFGAPQSSLSLRVYQLSSVFGRGSPHATTV